jgi:hypothetical protein
MVDVTITIVDLLGVAVTEPALPGDPYILNERASTGSVLLDNLNGPEIPPVVITVTEVGPQPFFASTSPAVTVKIGRASCRERVYVQV